MSRLLNRAERLRAIERMLYRAPNGMRVVEIAQECAVDRRTVYRDLDLLSTSGVPIWQDEGRFGIERTRYLTTVRLNFNEAVALYMAARLLARHAEPGSPYRARLATATGRTDRRWPAWRPDQRWRVSRLGPLRRMCRERLVDTCPPS